MLLILSKQCKVLVTRFRIPCLYNTFKNSSLIMVVMVILLILTFNLAWSSNKKNYFICEIGCSTKVQKENTLPFLFRKISQFVSLFLSLEGTEIVFIL